MQNRQYYVYILASKPFGAIYIGVINDLIQRVFEHRNGNGSKHTTKYNIFRLVYVEVFEDIENAILREKRLKNWNRAWKDELIEKDNPNWHDLYNQFCRENM